jgi:hypothetical protein
MMRLFVLFLGVAALAQPVRRPTKLTPPRGKTARQGLGGGTDLSAIILSDRNRLALKHVNEGLAKNPDDSDYHAAMAILCSRFGDHGCVQSEVLFARGSSVLEGHVVRAEADALRVAGEGRAAAELRAELLTEAMLPVEEARIADAIAQDYLSIGDLEKAHDWLCFGESAYPDSQRIQASWIELETAAHQWEEAESWVLYGLAGVERPSSDWLRASSTYFLEMGEPAVAVDRERARIGATLSDPELAAVRSRVYAATDQTALALRTASRTSFHFYGETWHPALVVAQAEAHWIANEPEEAKELVLSVKTKFPNNPDLRRMLARQPDLRVP